jgi:hypothetical protein
MSRRALSVVGLIFFAGLPHALASRSEVERCSHSEVGSFGPLHSTHNVVVGPLTLANGGDDPARTLANLQRIGWVKNPALVLPGHTVTLAIAPSARRRAGLLYIHDAAGHSPPTLRDTVPKVRFIACDAAHSKSRAGGRPVTFWSGGFLATHYPACVPVDIRVDHQRRVRHLVLSLGTGNAC